MSLKKYSTEQLIVELKRREIRAECDSALISRFVRESVNYTHAVTTDGQVFQLQPRSDDLNACIPPEDDAFAIPPRHVDNDEIMDRFIEIATREPKDMNWTGECITGIKPGDIQACPICGDPFQANGDCCRAHPELWCTYCGSMLELDMCRVCGKHGQAPPTHCPVHNIAFLGGVCHQCEREAEQASIDAALGEPF